MAEKNKIDSLSIEIGASSKNAVKNINALVDAMKALKDAASHIDNSAAGKISALASAMKELGDSKKVNISSKLGDNLSKLAGAMKAVKSEDISKLRQVASAVKTLDGTKGINISSKLAENIFNVAAAADSLTKTHADNLKMFGEALQTLSGGKLNIGDKLPDQLSNVAKAMDGITDDAIDRLRRMAEALSNLRGVNLQGFTGAARVTRPTQPTQTAPQQSGEPQIGGGSESARRQTNNINVAVERWKQLGKTIESISGKIKSASDALTKFGKNIANRLYARSYLKSLADDFSRIRNIISTFGRIAFYRAVRSAIKYVTDALQQGTENAYWFAKKFGDATSYIAEAYDNLSSSNFKMSNQLGAAWSTMIATIEPILIRLIELVTRAADAITQFFAALSGKTIYMRAIDYTKDWADETDKGAKKAKEWKNQLMGFDEINRLEAPSDTSGSNSADLYKDYENMFVESDVESAIGEFANRLKALWKAQDWKGLGEYIGNTLNGLFPSEETFKAIGQRVATAINGTVQTIYYALSTINFKEWGNRLAKGVNEIFDGVKFEYVGALFVKRFTSMIDFAAGFISGLKLESIGNAISDFLRGVFDEATKWLKTYEWEDAGKEFKSKVDSLIKGLKVEDLSNSIGRFFYNFNIELADFIHGADVGGLSAEIGAWIGRAIENVNLDDILVSLTYLLSRIILEIPSILMGANIGSSSIASGVFRSLGWDSVANFFDGITEKQEEGREKIKAITDWIANKLREEMLNSTGENSLQSVAQESGFQYIEGIVGGMDSESESLENITSEILKYLEDETKTTGSIIEADVKTTLQNVDNDVNHQLKPTETTISESLSNIKTNTDIATNALTEMSGVSISSLANDVTNSGYGIVNAMYSIRDAALEAWNWLTSVFSLSNAGSYSYDLPNGNSVSYNPNHGGVFASGGFPEDGLFFANHGELVGKFSNGRTAVANNEQITEGIASAVYEAFTTAFQQTGGSNDKEVNIYLDGEKIAKSTTRYQRQFARATG